MLHLIVENKSNKNFLLRSKNVFFDCDIINNTGETLVPNYTIGHARDWAEKNYYLLQPNSIDTITFFIQKSLYYNLNKGENYDVSLAYKNDQKRYRGPESEFRRKTLFTGKVILNTIRIVTCSQ